MFDQILLAIDGSEPSMHAAKVAGDLVRAVDAKELRIVIAYEPVPAYLGEPDLSRTINDRMSESKSILQEAEEAVGEVPAKLENELLQGHMAETIIDVAMTQHSDLIVMGTRGLGRLAGAFLGSNSQKVIHEAPCPVLLVK
jgi:nucleotide-binding universal stress UspA family protein